jgi:hypothetical protein
VTVKDGDNNVEGKLAQKVPKSQATTMRSFLGNSRGSRPWWGRNESVTTLLNYCRSFLSLNNTHISTVMFKKESVSQV